ncbi:sugar-binding protein [Paraliobacillus sediminis]|uniref:sugar-binding protein n=1 Tax=Paraliobacillus sediminis TaxID=1885916 RepID=UPI000E3E1F4B|nr:sugar-binding protein [Paraliobacillus sediminis]
MKRVYYLYIFLIVLLITGIAFSFSFYKKADTFDEKLTEAQPSSSVPTYHFALIGEEMDHDYWRLVGDGAKATESIYDVFIEYVGPSRSNPEEQLELLDMAIKSKVDGIIVQALNDDFTSLINHAVDAGIPVLTIDTDSPTSLRSAYIGTDNYAAGQLAGEALVKDTGGEATVGIITGSFDNAHHQLRIEGFRNVVDQVEGIKIVAIDESNITGVEAEEKAYTMFSENSEITAFYGTSSYDASGIIAAANSLNREDDLYVIGFDTLDENIDLLQNGDIDVLIEQQPYEMGYQSIGIMLDIIKGGSVEEINHTDVTAIRKADLANWTREKDETP